MFGWLFEKKKNETKAKGDIVRGNKYSTYSETRTSVYDMMSDPLNPLSPISPLNPIYQEQPTTETHSHDNSHDSSSSSYSSSSD